MTTTPSATSATALSEDLRLLRRGGGPLTDDDNLSERQVIFWIATAARQMVADRIDLAARMGQPVPDVLWRRLTLDLIELQGTYGVWLFEGDLPAAASIATTLLVRNVQADGNIVEERFSPNLAAMVWGHSRWAKPMRVYYAGGDYIRLALPLSDNEPLKITADVVVLPDVDAILANPDAPLPIPAEYLSELRTRILPLLQPLGAPDVVNNGTDASTDRR